MHRKNTKFFKQSNTFIMSGFFGVVSQQDCAKEVFYGTDYHSHLGTKRGGLAIYNNKSKTYHRDIHNLENSYFRTKFDDEILEYHGKAGIGCISDTDAQPILRHNSIGSYAVATVAKINNIKALSNELKAKRGLSFAEQSDGKINQTELVALLIHEGIGFSKEDRKKSFDTRFVEGIKHVQDSVLGSCSMLVLFNETIYAGRDRLGRTPIVIGSKTITDDKTNKSYKSFCVASESTSFLNLGYKLEHVLGPSEIVKVTADGYETIVKPIEESQVCSFLWVYYGYPPSVYDNEINVDEVRYRCGEMLARADMNEPGNTPDDAKKKEIDFVAGIPDSGVGHALGYSNYRHRPYMRPYVKYTPTWPRSFMPQDQEQRKLVAKMKLIPNEAIIKGKSGVFLDDSIVRGTQLGDNVRDLVECGIKDVHMRIACPPLIYPCEFLNFSRSRSSAELATLRAIMRLLAPKVRERDGIKETDVTKNPLKKALLKELSKTDLKPYADPNTPEYKAMVDEIRKELGLTTLKFQKLDDLVEAIGMPKCKLCTHCFDGSSWGYK